MGTTERSEGRLRRALSRLTSSDEQLEAKELQQHSAACGARAISTCPDRQLVTVSGSLRTVTLRPRAGVPALQAELYDGSGTVDVVWLGRRRISGVQPGRRLRATGRVGSVAGRRVMFNPRYELLGAARE